MPKPRDEKEAYSPEEARQRFEAALRGARVAGHKTMKDVAGKGRESKPAAKPPKKKGPRRNEAP
jgi:hypothetical protein